MGGPISSAPPPPLPCLPPPLPCLPPPLPHPHLPGSSEHAALTCWELSLRGPWVPGAGVGGRGWGDVELGSSHPRGSGRLWVSLVWGRELTPAVPFSHIRLLQRKPRGCRGWGCRVSGAGVCRLLAPPWDPIGLPVCLTVCPPPGEHSALVWGADRAGVRQALLPPGPPESACCFRQQQPRPARPSPGLPAGMQSAPGAVAWLVQARGGMWPGCCSSALGPWGSGRLSEAVSSRGHSTLVGHVQRRQDAFAKLLPPHPHPLHLWAPDLVTPGL